MKKEQDKYELKQAMNYFNLSPAYIYMCEKLFKGVEPLSLKEWESRFKQRKIVINNN